MRIQLVWDDRAFRKLAGHGVTQWEVEEVIYDRHSFVKGIGQKRYIVLGQTESGRYLKVIIESLGRGFFCLITSYEMGEADRRRFRRLAR